MYNKPMQRGIYRGVMAKKKYIETPEKMWELFESYVLHERKNPMYKTEYVGKDGERVNTPLQTPITFEGFECYLADLGIINDLSDYSANKEKRYSEYTTIITRIRQNCFVQNFKGASVGLFNPNLIARKLGLKEQTDNTNVNIEVPLFPDVSTDDSDK
jgi:hypothetical protein